eukprot:CAMPEP_0119493710 /NCGR_PEP_ID=MMETSP1344-20130328/17888_1 /TAXON_ID=236787 /ORGANISM="Florenciella parvula, Strain CCMP2471" /LENGTH=215 /DNA_ID=CAMNT_0007529159 /DNA_START=43 /DNA_END=690 /DNA_ORIENTATION=-
MALLPLLLAMLREWSHAVRACCLDASSPCTMRIWYWSKMHLPICSWPFDAQMASGWSIIGPGKLSSRRAAAAISELAQLATRAALRSSSLTTAGMSSASTAVWPFDADDSSARLSTSAAGLWPRSTLTRCICPPLAACTKDVLIPFASQRPSSKVSSSAEWPDREQIIVPCATLRSLACGRRSCTAPLLPLAHALSMAAWTSRALELANAWPIDA